MSVHPATRRLFAEMLIAACVCGGAYTFLVDSTRAKVASIRDEISRLQSDQSETGIGSLSEQQISELQRVTAERLRQIADRSLPSKDETSLYEHVSSLAASHGVIIDALNPVAQPKQNAPALPPGVQPGSPAAAQALADAAAQPQYKDVKSAYTIGVRGSYSDLACFIASLRNKLGYTSIRSIELHPTDSDSGPQIRADIATDHFAFDTAAVQLPKVAPATHQPMPIPATAGVQE